MYGVGPPYREITQYTVPAPIVTDRSRRRSTGRTRNERRCANLMPQLHPDMSTKMSRRRLDIALEQSLSCDQSRQESRPMAWLDPEMSITTSYHHHPAIDHDIQPIY
ncbi:unnamed protein product [Clonostachys byssicola]|uniref:Uncharacterized protein n=1 Tax=Clonostachys byssicola TaxID=160290 RepID=A0A9N9UKD8_9HYPO|nr:unnamed protein product [Clonostachys byssicola]